MSMRSAVPVVLFVMSSTVAAAAPAAPAGTAEAGAPGGAAPVAVEWGVDLRLRNVIVPRGIVEWFLSRATGASNVGLGVDVVRRRGNNELQFGIEYERINLGEGVLVQSGGNVPQDTVDYILSPDHAPENFGWLTFEFTFLHHTPLSKYVALRYGGGLGIGVMTGGVYRWDVLCATTATAASLEPGCIPGDHIPGGTGVTSSDGDGAAESSPVKYDLPPVFPVLNGIIGVQINPTPRSVVNIEAGLRTLPFFGMSAGYFF